MCIFASDTVITIMMFLNLKSMIRDRNANQLSVSVES